MFYLATQIQNISYMSLFNCIFKGNQFHRDVVFIEHQEREREQGIIQTIECVLSEATVLILLHNSLQCVGFSSVLSAWWKKDNVPFPVTAKFEVSINFTVRKL